MKKKHIVFSIIWIIFIYGCAAQEVPEAISEEPEAIEETPEEAESVAEEMEEETAKIIEQQPEEQREEAVIPKKPTTLIFSKKIKVADAIFSGIFFADDNFYVTYSKNNNVYIKRFDDDFKEIEEKKLTNVNRVNDIQVVYDNGFFYVVYSTAGKSGVPDKGLYLKKFDLSFNEIKGITITEEAPKTEATNDMFLSLINDLLYVGTFYIPTNPGPGNNFGHNIRTYDKELNLKKKFVANDLNHQNGASLVFGNNKFTIVSGANIDFNSQNRDLIILNYAQDWSFLNDKVISNEPDDEYWPMGAFFDGNTNYVAYTSREKFNRQFCPTCDMGNVYLKRFDQYFNFIGRIIVADEFPSHRAHVLKVGNKVYVAYDSSENNKFNVYVKEFAEE